MTAWYSPEYHGVVVSMVDAENTHDGRCFTNLFIIGVVSYYL